MVPIIFTCFRIKEHTIDQLLQIADGISVLYNTKREGLVFRSLTNPTQSFKVRSPEYLEWSNKKDKTI